MIRQLAVGVVVSMTAIAAQAQTPLRSLAEAPDLDPAADVVQVRLVAAREGDGYAYNGTRPGPVIRARIGDRLVVDLANTLDTPTTIHWHGAGAPYEMDGVTWARDPVAPGESFRYAFLLRRAGTFWYHPHFDTARQVDLGLYGVLVVEDPTEPAVDDGLILVFDTDDDVGPPSDRQRHGRARLRPRWRLNGGETPVAWRGVGGSRVRVRVLNASNTDYLDLQWPQMVQIASDQGLLSAEARPEHLVIAPGDRAEFVWRLGRVGFDVVNRPYSLNGGPSHGEPEVLLRVDLDAPADPPAPAVWPFSGARPSPPATHADVVWAFGGSDRSGRWRINGETFPDVTVAEIDRNTPTIIEVRNLSPTEHPFHLHGAPFEVIAIDGVAVQDRRVEDTVNVRIFERLQLRIVPDQIGDWMAHCHILPHAGEGMMTVLRVRPGEP